ncbi:JAB domain-containing protein [Chryseolinea sp. T2]|uniref:JAB domain-containing protein n=1 Tax=Chryseolinea sp. T2 TaxID=3129255 RepID=UPI00307845E5
MSLLTQEQQHVAALFTIKLEPMKTSTAEKTGKVSEIKIRYDPKLNIINMPIVNGSKDVAQVVTPLFKNILHHREAMYALYTNRANKVLGSFLVGLGGVAGVVADPKLVFQAALKSNASGIILAHNHPSGNRTPSQADIDLTKKVKEGARLLELTLLDHLIILPDAEYFSFADEGLL